MSAMAPMFTGAPPLPLPERPFPEGSRLLPAISWETTPPAEVFWIRAARGQMETVVRVKPVEASPRPLAYQQLDAALERAEEALSKAIRKAVAQREHERKCASCSAKLSCFSWSKLAAATATASSAYVRSRKAWEDIAHSVTADGAVPD